MIRNGFEPRLRTGSSPLRRCAGNAHQAHGYLRTVVRRPFSRPTRIHAESGEGVCLRHEQGQETPGER